MSHLHKLRRCVVSPRPMSGISVGVRTTILLGLPRNVTNTEHSRCAQVSSAAFRRSKVLRAPKKVESALGCMVRKVRSSMLS